MKKKLYYTELQIIKIKKIVISNELNILKIYQLI